MNKQLDEKARAYLMNAKLTKWQIERLEKVGYFTAPAAMRHHLNRPQGLIEHSINVVDRMLALGAFKDRRSSYRVGMLHDLVKCFCYRAKVKDGKTTYSFNQPPYPGHGVASALICDDLNIDLFPDERAAIVWHMGAYGLDEDTLKEFGAAKLRYPSAILLTHAADDLAATEETIAAFNESYGEDDEGVVA